MSTESRIADLEEQLAATQTELAALKARQAGPRVAPPPRDEGVRITYPSPLSIELPDGGQQRKLVEIISGRHEKLTPRYSMKWHDEEELEFYAGLVTSMRFISTLGRAAAPDTSRYLSHWVDLCKDWVKLNNISLIGNVGASFYLAAIALRVPFVLGDNSTGVVPSLGLKQHGGALIIADDWRKTLSGDVLAPTPPERRFAPPSPAIVR